MKMSVLLNVFLFIIKFIAGKISGSVSITADAFNNLTDAGTVLFTSVGLSISSIGPGKNHPDGHGKFEWVFALITSFSVLLVGWELFKDSIYSIKNPADMVFSWITLLILILSISIKLFLYFYNMKKSKTNHSLSLKAVAIDSLSDSFSTMAVLISLVLNTVFHWHVDGFFGLAVSVLIMYNALKSASESISSIVGTAASDEKLQELTDTVKSYFDSDVPIIGLEIKDNGYNRHLTSFHLASTDLISADDILLTVPRIQKDLKNNFGYESIIQVEKTAEKEIGDGMIQKAKEQLLGAELPYQLTDARVLACENHTYQLVSSILVPWMNKEKMAELNQLVLSPAFFGLGSNDSVLVKVILRGDQQEEHEKRRHHNKDKKLPQN